MENFELVGEHETEKLKRLVEACATGSVIEFEHSYIGHVRAVILWIEFRRDRSDFVKFREV